MATEFTGLVAVVSLPQDSPYAPDRTFAVPFDAAFYAANPCPTSQNTPPPADLRCAFLPSTADITGTFTAHAVDAVDVGWNLGNGSNATWLPVQATYRLFWPAPTSSALVDAKSLGLAVDAVSSDVVQATAPPGTTLPPGPNGGASMLFHELNLPPGTYELTLMPASPLDHAFPPDVEVVTVPSGTQTPSILLKLDHTRGTDPGGNITFPTFDFTRDQGLDGWTTYLRDVTTLRRLSNVVTLSGITMSGVQLFTDHVPQTADALTNAELVVSPPPGQAVPTYVVSPTAGQILRNEPYPTLPPNLRVSGAVTAADGSPLQADLEFEATGIDTVLTSGKQVLNTANFVYDARATAQIGPTGASTYSVTLPQGQYRVTIRPVDAAAAVTIASRPLLVDAMHPREGNDFSANAPQIVEGTAAVADGRPLAGATVEAVPVGCASSPTTASCMPRAAQTTTADDGSFAFGGGVPGDTPGLDQGSYVLRIEPADGTRLPWVFAPGGLLVGPTPVTEPLVTIPAPAYAGLRLYDPASNPVINAVVRMFELEPQGPAIEVARAITDTNGDYDMYLAPTALAQ